MSVMVMRCPCGAALEFDDYFRSESQAATITAWHAEHFHELPIDRTPTLDQQEALVEGLRAQRPDELPGRFLVLFGAKPKR